MKRGFTSSKIPSRVANQGERLVLTQFDDREDVLRGFVTPEDKDSKTTLIYLKAGARVAVTNIPINASASKVALELGRTATYEPHREGRNHIGRHPAYALRFGPSWDEAVYLDQLPLGLEFSVVEISAARTA